MSVNNKGLISRDAQASYLVQSECIHLFPPGPLGAWQLSCFHHQELWNSSLSVHIFSKWISSYVMTSYDVPNMYVHLVILHSNIVQPMLVVALIYFYIPDICFGDFCSNPYQLMGNCKVQTASEQEEWQRIWLHCLVILQQEDGYRVSWNIFF